jgi:hypothetical protein
LGDRVDGAALLIPPVRESIPGFRCGLIGRIFLLETGLAAPKWLLIHCFSSFSGMAAGF